ncbi:hypothetical protein QNA24_25700 [Rhodococcus qingshengii]|uniref:hypothetical protein n=1 Tax=Rhodococcus qingshengii TaxID=334542 RepID=UPI0024BB6ACC|nr:hypothetical protein [Rhodococcus qingshengii]MDJ0489778.1 hypothetical protein [Rhodococcus qingshengii]
MTVTDTPSYRASRHGMQPDPHAETLARLTVEFAGRFSERGTEIVLDGCIADLSGVSLASMPEMSERLARERIASYCRSRDRDFTGLW